MASPKNIKLNTSKLNGSTGMKNIPKINKLKIMKLQEQNLIGHEYFTKDKK